MENNRLGTEKVSKLLLSLAAPAICAQIVMLLYNLVDRIYIGWMADGMLAMAATEEERGKVRKMTDFCRRFAGRNGVPDPYYGGAEGFELVLDMLEDAVDGLLDQLLEDGKGGE